MRIVFALLALVAISASQAAPPSETNTAVAIDPSTGAVLMNTSGEVAVPTVTVTAPSSVQTGSAFPVSWSTSGFVGNVSCTASASTPVSGWSNVLSASPTQVSAPITVQTLTLILQCTGNQFTAVGSAVVSVIANSSCRPPGYKRDENSPFIPYQLQATTYASLMGNSFPSFNSLNLGSLGPGLVIAAEFIAPATTSSDGYFEITSLASGPGTPITSLSPCPGDIDYRLNGTPAFRGCMRVGNESGPQWTINQGQPLSVIRCVLTPGTRYYLNIAFENCDGGVCNYRLASRDATSRSDQEATKNKENQEGQGK